MVHVVFNFGIVQYPSITMHMDYLALRWFLPSITMHIDYTLYPSITDDRAVYCSFSESNFVYLWGGYVLHNLRLFRGPNTNGMKQ